MPSFFHSGCLGDICYAMPTLRVLGGGELLVDDRPWTKRIVERIPLFRRLWEAQDYVTSVRRFTNENIDVDFSTFRNGGLPYGKTLYHLQAKWVNAPLDEWKEPWIKCDPSPLTRSRIIVNKSPRYGNGFFPWKELVNVFGEHMLFVGLDSEYRTFCANYGEIERYLTRDLMDVAEAIAGSELFIGNQSSPYSVCEGLKHRSILEVCLEAPDCIYPRDNAIYCYDGGLEFEALGKYFSSETYRPIRNINTQESPPGGWRLNIGDKHLSHYSMSALKGEGISECLKLGTPCPDLDDKIIRDTLEVHPHLGMPNYSIRNLPVMAKIKSLLEKA